MGVGTAAEILKICFLCSFFATTFVLVGLILAAKWVRPLSKLTASYYHTIPRQRSCIIILDGDKRKRFQLRAEEHRNLMRIANTGMKNQHLRIAVLTMQESPPTLCKSYKLRL
jgi:mitochondrial fission protein ELM1